MSHNATIHAFPSSSSHRHTDRGSVPPRDAVSCGGEHSGSTSRTIPANRWPTPWCMSRHARRVHSPKTPPGERVVMDQRDREFVPYVLPVQVGTPVQFPNSDSIRHHVYSFSPAKTCSELPLYKGTRDDWRSCSTNPARWRSRFVIHDWMIGYIYVLETPYFGKTGDRGEGVI